MAKKKVYLSGGFYNTWKGANKKKLEQFELLDPEVYGGGGIPAEYVGRDFKAIDEADVVLAVQDDYPYIYGTAAEIGYAVATKTPVIYVCLTKRVDSFLSGCSRAVFTEVDAALDFMVERYGEKVDKKYGNQ